MLAKDVERGGHHSVRGDGKYCQFAVPITNISRYLEHHTKIPVPHIHTYGRDARLTKEGTSTQTYIVMDRVTGNPVEKKHLVEAGDEECRYFCSQLIEVLAELRSLEFSRIGSLLPNSKGSDHPPFIGPLLTMSAATHGLPPPPSFTSSREYLNYQFDLVSRFFMEPSGDDTVELFQEELYALHYMRPEFPRLIKPQLDKGPYALAHLDLRSPNIIVDEDYRIQGIIDWEFTSTIPIETFAPPSWITGYDENEITKRTHIMFREALEEKAETNRMCNKLLEEWYGQNAKCTAGGSKAFAIAHIIRRPTDLPETFASFFHPNPSEPGYADFFDKHPDLALQVERRMEMSQRYKRYLKENGLFETEAHRFLAASKALKIELGWEKPSAEHA